MRLDIRERLEYALTQHIVDNMSEQELLDYAFNSKLEILSEFSDEELVLFIEKNYPELGIDHLVDID